MFVCVCVLPTAVPLTPVTPSRSGAAPVPHPPVSPCPPPPPQPPPRPQRPHLHIHTCSHTHNQRYTSRSHTTGAKIASDHLQDADTHTSTCGTRIHHLLADDRAGLHPVAHLPAAHMHTQTHTQKHTHTHTLRSLIQQTGEDTHAAQYSFTDMMSHTDTA